LLSEIHKSLFIYYRVYADSKGFMNFERFTKFCHDFEVFPDLIAKSKLHSIFYTLANISQEKLDSIEH
jgi:hypothetical protein